MVVQIQPVKCNLVLTHLLPKTKIVLGVTGLIGVHALVPVMEDRKLATAQCLKPPEAKGSIVIPLPKQKCPRAIRRNVRKMNVLMPSGVDGAIGMLVRHPSVVAAPSGRRGASRCKPTSVVNRHLVTAQKSGLVTPSRATRTLIASLDRGVVGLIAHARVKAFSTDLVQLQGMDLRAASFALVAQRKSKLVTITLAILSARRSLQLIASGINGNRASAQKSVVVAS